MVKKKFFAKAFALAMATGLLAAAAPTMTQTWVVKAAGEEAKAQPVIAKVNYDEMMVEITPGKDAEKKSDNYVFLEVMKKKDDTKQGTVYPYPCNGSTSVKVDLSFLKITKESYLRVWGDKSGEKVTLTVSAQPAKIKYKYAAQTFPELKVGEDDKNAQLVRDYYAKSFGITDTSLSYRIYSLYHGTKIALVDEEEVTSGKTDGKWDVTSDLKSDMLKNVKVTGATLIIYQDAAENIYKKDAAGADTNEIDKAGHPAGAEVKVKIPAAPKAPKVSIDYVKGTVKLPKNAQYGIIDETGNIAYVALANGGALSPEEILEKVAEARELTDADQVKTKTKFIDDNLKAGFNLVVRTNDTKKGASNPTFVSVKETVSCDDDLWGKITRTTKDADNNDVVTNLATYEFSEKGVTVTVKEGAFEYEESGKWKKISSGKLIKDKTSELTIRMAGVKDKDETKASLPSKKMTIKKSEDQSKVELTGALPEVKVGATTPAKLTVNEKTLQDRNGKIPTGEDLQAVVYKWESSDTSIATLSGTTKEVTVTGVKAGKCTITVTVTFKDKTTAKASFEIEVKPADSTSGG